MSVIDTIKMRVGVSNGLEVQVEGDKAILTMRANGKGTWVKFDAAQLDVAIKVLQNARTIIEKGPA